MISSIAVHASSTHLILTGNLLISVSLWRSPNLLVSWLVRLEPFIKSFSNFSRTKIWSKSRKSRIIHGWLVPSFIPSFSPSLSRRNRYSEPLSKRLGIAKISFTLFTCFSTIGNSDFGLTPLGLRAILTLVKPGEISLPPRQFHNWRSHES